MRPKRTCHECKQKVSVDVFGLFLPHVRSHQTLCPGTGQVPQVAQTGSAKRIVHADHPPELDDDLTDL